MNSNTKITINAKIDKSLETVWNLYTLPEHVTKWNNASSDWHTPRAENDLQIGGTFLYRMESKDGAHGFDFSGTYTEVILHKVIKYILEDNREVTATFKGDDATTEVTIIFDAETENSIEMQREGWQSILNNFKRYAESL